MFIVVLLDKSQASLLCLSFCFERSEIVNSIMPLDFSLPLTSTWVSQSRSRGNSPIEIAFTRGENPEITHLTVQRISIPVIANSLISILKSEKPAMKKHIVMVR